VWNTLIRSAAAAKPDALVLDAVACAAVHASAATDRPPRLGHPGQPRRLALAGRGHPMTTEEAEASIGAAAA
jgi:hypothetical protein